MMQTACSRKATTIMSGRAIWTLCREGTQNGRATASRARSLLGGGKDDGEAKLERDIHHSRNLVIEGALSALITMVWVRPLSAESFERSSASVTCSFSK